MISATAVCRFVFAAVFAAALSGCNILPEARPENSHYYVLESKPAADAPPSGAVRIGLRPIEVPAYLKHKAVAERTGENEVRYATEAFWAEPLDAGIARVLREQLAARANVFVYPFPAQLPRDYELTVRVLSAEGGASGVRFVAVIELLRVGDSPELVVRKEFTAPATPWNRDYSQLARGLSQAVAALADEVVASVPKK
jgi:hypothetical protein